MKVTNKQNSISLVFIFKNTINAFRRRRKTGQTNNDSLYTFIVQQVFLEHLLFVGPFQALEVSVKRQALRSGSIVANGVHPRRGYCSLKR